MKEPPVVLTVKDVYLLRDVLASMLTIAKKMRHYSEISIAKEVTDEVTQIESALHQCYATLLEELS